jgi:hypothetical protein|tara:strand:- start:416 stop:550 length:135 start_codon:yes stop_codon:yes gene_type:complete
MHITLKTVKLQLWEEIEPWAKISLVAIPMDQDHMLIQRNNQGIQ